MDRQTTKILYSIGMFALAQIIAFACPPVDCGPCAEWDEDEEACVDICTADECCTDTGCVTCSGDDKCCVDGSCVTIDRTWETSDVSGSVDVPPGLKQRLKML